MNSPVRVALVNDHPLVLDGLRALLRPHQAIEVVELDALVPVGEKCDIALLDTHAMATNLEQEVAQRLAEPAIEKVVVYAWETDENLVRDALDSGAQGVLSKTLDSDALAEALVRVSQGEQVVETGVEPEPDLLAEAARKGRDWPGRRAGLSMRESEMISLICQGLSNDQIARSLYLSPNSVKSYIRSAYHKINVNSRSQAVIWGIDNGLRPVADREAG
ncbi:LuxR C-terminal-related transcriptional regulator [Luteococcus sp. OSA5]|uniref:LuxR C-terminal-related transcriptional regulator n=1 Tax=Luteococcus sp. OSA5 TaxID=3401630 RepID=UPI003B4282A5